MSQLIKWEVEITLGSGLTRAEAVSIAKRVYDELPLKPDNDDFDGAVVRSKGETTLVFFGETNDIVRLNLNRDAVVVGAVRRVVPEARIQTRWLYLEHSVWDDEFDTGDE